MGVKNLILWIILFCSLVGLFYLLHRRFKARNVWATIKGRYTESAKKKEQQKKAFKQKYGSMENGSVLYKADRLVLTSGLKSRIPALSGEVLILFMIMLLLAGYIFARLISGNFFVALFVGIVAMAIPYFIVKAFAGRNYNRIEDGIPIYLSILQNHAKESSDIVTIMQSSLPSLDGALKDLTQMFTKSAEQSGNTDMAFDYVKEAVENRSLRIIFMNLKNCSHYMANYEEVLAQMSGQIAAGLSAREDRKGILFSMKLSVIAISAIAILIVMILGAGLSVDVRSIMTQSILGQGLMFLTGVLYVWIAAKMFGYEK